jgi:hypothetical protein
MLKKALENDPNNAELLWRLSRASRLMIMDSRTPADEKKRLSYECLESAKKAAQIDEKNWAAHKWVAIGNCYFEKKKWRVRLFGHVQ